MVVVESCTSVEPEYANGGLSDLCACPQAFKVGYNFSLKVLSVIIGRH